MVPATHRAPAERDPAGRCLQWGAFVVTVLGFKARNHPQQLRRPRPGAKGRGDPERDERYTPRELIDRLHRSWGFTVDAASDPAAPAAQVIGRSWSRAEDGLSRPWDGERVWCNPPYSSIEPWIAKAWASRCVAILLVPANRTEQGWWHRLVEPYRDRDPRGFRTEFIERRVQFGTPRAPEGAKWHSSPPFGCVLLIWPTPERAEFRRVSDLRLPAELGRVAEIWNKQGAV
jgi:hypothetical protein